ncbi:MAG: carbohydrate-binding protein, partial [Bacteroidales bacterium]|nr:carbohydrate-binding protein [Bacteroidales bacterium]
MKTRNITVTPHQNIPLFMSSPSNSHFFEAENSSYACGDTRANDGSLVTAFSADNCTYDFANINVANSGTHNFYLRAVSAYASSAFEIRNQANNIVASAAIPQQVDWATYITYMVQGHLSAGNQQLRVQVNGNAFDFNWWKIEFDSAVANEGLLYTYNIICADEEGNAMTITDPSASLPAWLSLTDNGNGTAMLQGTPALVDVGSYPVTLRVSDGFGYSEQHFTLYVQELSSPPTDIGIANVDLNEEQPIGTAIAVFSATDPNIGDNHAYSLVTGAGSAQNGYFYVSGDTLYNAQVIDYEKKPAYSIRVRATDNSPDAYWYEKALVLNFVDINDKPRFIWNGINNGGFENGLANWSLSMGNASVQSAFVAEGSNALEIGPDPWTWINNISWTWQMGETYTFEAWGRSKIDGDIKEVGIQNNLGEVVNFQFATTNFEYRSASYTIPGGLTWLQVFVNQLGAADNGYADGIRFYLDNALPANDTLLTVAWVDSLYSYNFNFEDEEGDPVTLTAETKPTWLTLTNNGDGTATL